MKLTGEAKFLLGVVVATVAIIGASFVFFSKPAPPKQALSRDELISADSYRIGNASASAYLVEFSDYQCPACKAFDQTVREIVQKYGDRLLFVYRDFPLEQHPYSVPSALAAGAAANQGKFWEMHHLLFDNQERFSDSLWTELAQTAGLDTVQFENDMKNPEIKAHMERDRAAGIRLGINATPTFYLNGTQLTLTSPADLLNAVNEAMK
jgi:protein-disulfide isomerase